VTLNFLGKWFGGKRADAAEVETVRTELDRLAAERPAFSAPLVWLRTLLPDLLPVADVPSLDLTPGAAREKLAAGVPLLRGERVAVDEKAFRRRWESACKALAGGALPPHKPDAPALVAAVLANRAEDVYSLAETMGLDPSLAATILRFTLFPVFTALAAKLAPLRGGAVWERGYCPTCGSWPLLAEFRGLDQSRYLRCGLCADGWEAPRLWCPFCGNRDPARLTFLHAQGEESHYRAAVCEACRGYVKTVTTLTALPPLPLLAADAATLHLDLAAAERGYHPAGAAAG
jgi:FdhE protein